MKRTLESGVIAVRRSNRIKVKRKGHAGTVAEWVPSQGTVVRLVVSIWELALRTRQARSGHCAGDKWRPTWGMAPSNVGRTRCRDVMQRSVETTGGVGAVIDYDYIGML